MAHQEEIDAEKDDDAAGNLIDAKIFRQQEKCQDGQSC